MSGGRRSVRIVLVVLAAVLVFDALALPARWALPRPVVARDMITAADTHGRARMLNVVVGIAIREAAPWADRWTLEVPEGLDDLLDIPADEFIGVPQATLNPSLMRPMLSGRVQVESYDPVLDDDAAAEFMAGAPTLYPRDVSIMPIARSESGSADEVVFRLFVDSERCRVFLFDSREGAGS